MAGYKLPPEIINDMHLPIPAAGDEVASFFDEYELAMQHDAINELLHSRPSLNSQIDPAALPQYPPDFFQKALPAMVKAVLHTN